GSSQSSGIGPLPPLHLRHQEESVERRRRVGEERLVRQAGRDGVRRLGKPGGSAALLRRRGGREPRELVDVVDHLPELRREARLLLRGEAKAREVRNLPY